MNTPLLLIAWRRPHMLRQLINAIRPVAPSSIYVACDGPNSERPGEADKVKETREVIANEIDWPCQIERLYSDTNQGCRHGPIKAITWFFEQVEEGIILEDDCIPSVAFFDYCEWALWSYRGDKRVMHINGNNFSAPSQLFSDEISFASLPQVWGWASWSDRWELFEGNPFYLFREVRPWSWALSTSAIISKQKHLDSLKKGLDAWDYQWQITVLNNRGFAICPRGNLISNVGVGSDASHTFNDHSRTFLQTDNFTRPSNLPPVRNNVRLTRFFEKKMGLSFSPRLALWMCKTWLIKLRHFLKHLIVLAVFRNFTPVVIASTGRSGSTMFTDSIAFSFVQDGYPFMPSSIKTKLIDLAKAYFDRLNDVNAFNRSPVIKTHDLFNNYLSLKFKYIFVYGDPLDSAVSALNQGELRGSAWLDEHIFHLCGSGSPSQILYEDVLNYEGQILSWQDSPAFFIHYSEIWARKDKLSGFLGFPLLLPPERKRSKLDLAAYGKVNYSLFDKLRLIEKRFRENRGLN